MIAPLIGGEHLAAVAGHALLGLIPADVQDDRRRGPCALHPLADGRDRSIVAPIDLPQGLQLSLERPLRPPRRSARRRRRCSPEYRRRPSNSKRQLETQPRGQAAARSAAKTMACLPSAEPPPPLPRPLPGGDGRGGRRQPLGEPFPGQSPVQFRPTRRYIAATRPRAEVLIQSLAGKWPQFLF